MLTTQFRRGLAKGHYLDTQATSIIDPRVMDAMIPYEIERYGNAHSKQHPFGREAMAAVEDSRKSIASLINCNSKEILFTSGATESNNLAIKGAMHFLSSKKKKHLIISAIEHKCVIESARSLQREGYELTFLPVGKDGIVKPDALAKEIRPDTGLVSVMTVNNEMGTIQPIKELAKICKQKGVWIHTDAAQAVGRIPVDVQDMGVNLMSISGHKMHGPKGIGALFVGNRPRVRLEPVIHGGGQERGIRSGTLAVPLIVGIGKAAEIAKREMKQDAQYIEELGRYLAKRLLESVPESTLNGSDISRWFGNVNVSFDCVEGESLMAKIPDFAVSSGSACTSDSLEPSYVLKAIGVTDELAHTSIRIGISKFTTKEELDLFVNQISASVEHLRELSPLWEMKNEGIDPSTIKWMD